MKITTILFTLILSAGYTSFVNAAAFPDLEVNINKNTPSFTNMEIGMARLAISGDAEKLTAMLIRAKSSGFPKELISSLEQQVNYYRAVMRRLIPNWEPNADMVSFYVQTLSGKNGEVKQKELLNSLPDKLNVNGLVMAGFKQNDFDALIKWDRMNQPAGGPNWSNTGSSPSSTTNSPPQSPKTTQTLTYSHGRYVGETLNGKAHGNGSYTSAKSGTVYTGQFIADTFSGNGTMTWTNGNKFIGVWDNDVGVSGTLTYPNGSSSKGMVVKGQFVPTPVQTSSQSLPPTPNIPSNLVWNHNNSQMKIVMNNDLINIYYLQPRKVMIDAGAKPNDLLVNGTIRGNQITGTAKIFAGGCGQFPYSVSGFISNNGSVINLNGEAPVVNRSNCQVTKYVPDPLSFNVISQSPQQTQTPTPIAQSTPQSQPPTPQTNNVTVNFSSQVQPKTGVEYRYWNDKSYQSNDKEVYLNEGNYKYLCENTKGVTKLMASSSGFGNNDFGYLLNNGSFDDWDVKYDPSYKENKCRIEMTVSGMRNGNSRRVTVRGYVNEFIVNDKGNILAHGGQAY